MRFPHPTLMLFVTLGASAAPAPLRNYREYPSSVDPQLRLFARFECAAPSGVLLVNLHGWHGAVKRPHADDVPDPLAKNHFVISPEMRGRGDATGQPDCNGWELQDVIDAVEFARRAYRERLASPEIVFLSGGSGGGGNALALVGKFPDYFTAARVYYGISDYALWHAFDRKGEFRDELEGLDGQDPRGRRPWIGGSPETNPEAYRSRGGLTTVGNLLTPTLVFHGSDDLRVPVLHARLWVGAAHGAGRGALVTYHEQAGVGDHRHNGNETKEQLAFRNRTGDQFLRTPRTPPAVPDRGTFTIAGYLKTARFEVILDSIDYVGRVAYDLPAGRFEVFAPTARKAVVRVRQPDGTWTQSETLCRR